MTLQEMLKEERLEGKQEGIQKGLTVVRRVNTGELTLEEGADELEISVDELREIMVAPPKAASVVVVSSERKESRNGHLSEFGKRTL